MAEEEIGKVLDRMAYGLYIVGSQKDGDVDGMMADWVMQVSFRPRLLAVSIENDARTLENVRGNGRFTVNFLSQDEDAMHLASRFAQPYYDAKVRGRGAAATATAIHHKLDDVAYETTAAGCPVLRDAMAWLECTATHFVSAGDHTIVIGSVADGGLLRESEPLTSTYAGWNYSG